MRRFQPRTIQYMESRHHMGCDPYDEEEMDVLYEEGIHEEDNDGPGFF